MQKKLRSIESVALELEGRYSQMFVQRETYINYWQRRARWWCIHWAHTEPPARPPRQHHVRVIIDISSWTVWTLWHGQDSDRVVIQGDTLVLITTEADAEEEKQTLQELKDILQGIGLAWRVTHFTVRYGRPLKARLPTEYLDLDSPHGRKR